MNDARTFETTANVVLPREASARRGAPHWQSGCCRAVIGWRTDIQPISIDHLSRPTRQPALAWDCVVGLLSVLVVFR